MLVFLGIAVLCAVAFGASLLIFDDINLADALDFGDDGGAGWFSLRALLLFGLGFGTVGALVMAGGGSYWWSSIAGIAAGGALYFVGVGIAYVLSRQTSNSVVQLDSIIGKRGIVVDRILPGQSGVIEVGGPNGIIHQQARAAHTLERGTAVAVTGVTGTVAWVEGDKQQ